MAQITKLSPQHKLFAKNYVACGFNAARAYRETYGVDDDNNNGSRLLRNPLIKDEIDREMKERCEELHINERKVLLKLNEMAFASADDENYSPNVQLKALDLLQKQMGLQKQKIDANVEQTTTITVTIDE